jgi:ATP-dependent DNA helicase RecG
MLEGISSGEAALVVGTHAVIQEQVHFKNLALAIIDEQHRFGVAQRLALREKMHASTQTATSVDGLGPLEPHIEPHMLMMSATPIPRTLAMSYYADLDVSTLDELPQAAPP